MLLIESFVAAAFVSGLVLWGLLNSGLAWRIALDRPNARSLHLRPTPRVGGWGLVASILGLAPWFAGNGWIVVPLALLIAISLLDDRFGLSTRLRLVIHAIAAAVFVSGAEIAVGLMGATLVAVVLIWMINLFNFMDGSDGLAGGMALTGFGTYAVAASWCGEPALAGWSAIVAGAAFGFLCFNYYPAKVFMGDAGSIPLGFLAGALGVLGWEASAWPVWFPLVVFLPFVMDATVTLLRRILRRQRFWEAHREHYYQRLVRSGFGHARTAWFAYGLMVICGASALAALNRPVALQVAVIAVDVAVLCCAGLWIDSRWRRSAP